MRHYDAWYPQFGSRLNAIMLDKCAEQLHHYQMWTHPYNACAGCQAATVQTCLADAPGWMQANIAIGIGCLPEAVEACILANTPEWMKANMSAASVLLGLLPTILSLAGSSTAETGLLAQRRPFLAFLLAAGAPAVSPVSMSEYRDSGEFLYKRPGSLDVESMLDVGAAARSAIVALQYLLAAGAVANVAHTSWQLGTRTLCSFSTESVYHPLLWTLTATLAPIFGAIPVKLLINMAEDRVDPPPTSVLGRLRRAIGVEFQLSANQPQATVAIKRESYEFIVASWCTSILTILHIIYGTLTFSSMLLISTQDAVGVAGRYLISTIVCKIILKFELSGIRARLRGPGEPHGSHELRPVSEHVYVDQESQGLLRRDIRKSRTCPPVI